jgi:serine/threonine-protein kinase
VKVLDFGLAMLVEQDLSLASDAQTQSLLTQPGVIVGTVPYLSPEQVKEEKLDARSDLFSLGAVIYEMVSGRQPFAAESVGATLSAILTKEPEPLSSYAGGAPAELDRIVQKCLDKDKERRYQSARELGLGLRRLKQGKERMLEGKQRQRMNPWRWIALIAAAMLVVIVAAMGLYRITSREGTVTRSISSIAVLPFANEGADPSTDYLSDGISEGLINNLAQLPNVKVIARTSVFRYKGREIDAQQVGRELKVEAVLTGSIRKLNDNLSISAALADARDNSHIWGAQYNRGLSDVFALQEEISREISERLRVRLNGDESKRLAKRHTDNVEAYQLFLRGRHFLNRRTPDDVKRSIDYLKQAVVKDPDYALAYAALADAYALLGDYGALPAKEAFHEAESAASHALELDNELAEAYTALAHVRLLSWDWPSADAEYQRAIELKPSYATAHQWYSNHLIAMGRSTEAAAEIRRALDLDPLSLIINEVAGRHLYLMGEYDQAIAQQLKTLELEPNFAPAHAALGLVYVQKARYPDAITAFKKAIDLSGTNPDYVAEMAYAYAASGQRGKAKKLLDDLLITSKQRYVSPYYLALVHLGLGEVERAVTLLEKAFDHRTSELMFIKQEPMFQSLRPNPRFNELVRRIRLSP